MSVEETTVASDEGATTENEEMAAAAVSDDPVATIKEHAKSLAKLEEDINEVFVDLGEATGEERVQVGETHGADGIVRELADDGGLKHIIDEVVAASNAVAKVSVIEQRRLELLEQAKKDFDSLVTGEDADKAVMGVEVTGNFIVEETDESAVNAARRNVHNATEHRPEPPKYRMNVNGSPTPKKQTSVKGQFNKRTGAHKIHEDRPVNNAAGTHRE